MQNGTPYPAPGPLSSPTTARRPRLWPGVAIVALYWAALKVPAWIAPQSMEQFKFGFFGSSGLMILFVVWWLLFSRVTWMERFVGLLACVAIASGMWHLYDPSVQGRNPQFGVINLLFNELPIVLTGWVFWLFIARSFNRQARVIGFCVVFLLTWGAFTAVKFKGMTGRYSPEFALRWTPTAEEQYIADRAKDHLKAESVADAGTTAALELTPADWPGFRGPDRNSRRPGARIATDWNNHPPKQLWRRRIGPGWSSFAVVGQRLFTQEQLGKVERVVCLDAGTGQELWAHVDETRHLDNESGVGPRATPTFHDGRIYALGATGKLNCLDAITGKPIWSRDIVKDSGAEEPMWGVSSSPLVVQGIVTVFAGGPEDKSVLGYRANSGDLAWHAGNGAGSYASLQPARIAGVDQLLIANSEGVISFDPGSGKQLWIYDWSLGKDFNRVTQPAVVGDSDVLVGSGFGTGTRRVHVTHKGQDWTTDQVWESKALSPYYNDFVVHKGNIYGFHTSFFTCVNLETGKSIWRERGYANGQVLLLPDQDLLLVINEEGVVALIEAKPDARKELGRFTAFAGKTWNHPVVARGKLYMRNGEEAACYDLSAEAAAVASK